MKHGYTIKAALLLAMGLSIIFGFINIKSGLQDTGWILIITAIIVFIFSFEIPALE